MGVNGEKVLFRVRAIAELKLSKTGPPEAEQLLLLDSFISSVEYIRFRLVNIIINMIVVHVGLLQHADNKESRNPS